MKTIRVVFLAILFAICASSSLQAQFEVRKWTNSDGGKIATAKFVEQSGNVIILRRNNGKKLEVSVADLSTIDRRYLAGLGKTIARNSARKYRKLEESIMRAEQILAFYDEELKKNLPKEQRDWIVARKNNLVVPAEERKIQVNGEFLTREQFKELRNQSSGLVDECIEILKDAKETQNSNMLKKADGIIRKASKLDPYSIRAEFNMGIAAVFYVRDYSKAESHFEAVVSRCERFVPTNDIRQRNLAGAKHNLALLAVREQKLQKAEKLFREALGYADPKLKKSVSRNFARLLSLMKRNSSSRKFIKDGMETEYLAWHKELGSESAGNGWIYRGFLLQEGEEVAEEKLNLNSLADAVCLRCKGKGDLHCARCKGRGEESYIVWVPRKDPNGVPMPPVAVTKWKTCMRCRGNKTEKCWGCAGSGKQ